MTSGTVVVLGSAGRNFGAGMTGGKAYVLDIAGDFEQRYNAEYVHAHRVEATDDVRELHSIIYQHLELTNSTRAREILMNWPDYQSMCWKVVPVEPAPLTSTSPATTEEAATTLQP